MATNWRDIQERAVTFAHTYADAKDEDRDAKPFWKDLMQLYGVDARQVGAFEERVRIHGRPGVGKIDYFAPRKFIIEHKSLGKDLESAYRQAMDYFDALPQPERPRHIIVSDFGRIRVYDLEASAEDRVCEFALADLPKRVQSLAFFTDDEVRVFKPEEPIDVKAVRAIGKLHDALRSSNYPPEHLSPLLTRLVFLFFADDTGIFDPNALRAFLEENTAPDGSDIGDKLNAIFQVLNTPEDKRQSTLYSALSDLPYVNGGMFSGYLPVVFASRTVRDTILACSAFDWSGVSPAIFGSMFQSVMDEKQRHDLGAHYTSEKNILKVIGPLFLDDLHAELETAKTNREKLLALQDKLAAITLLDPACGCGNFLVVSYRELRKIENEIIARLHHKTSTAKVEAGHAVLPLGIDLKTLSKLSVERMYGIEIEPFPAEVAKLSLWLTDHLMNAELGKIFGKPFVKLPLTEAPHIVQGNALRIDWETVVPKAKLSYILGNPPFLGKQGQSEEQKIDMALVWGKANGTGVLDFVTCWYKKAADLIKGTHITVALVSTNSITQGENVSVLWPLLISSGVHIHFAHRTFKWSNEATGKAAVHCVIVGFGNFEVTKKRLFSYTDIAGLPAETRAKNINPYLVDAPFVVVTKRRTPLQSQVKPIAFGSMPNDGGQLILSNEDCGTVLAEDASATYIRPLLGSEEFINGKTRYCLWLKDVEPEVIRKSAFVMQRVDNVRTQRLLSKREGTRKLASAPTLFGEIRQPESGYLAIPEVSSENRLYIPIGFLGKEVIATNKLYTMEEATLYDFGVIVSVMHMTWTRAVAGRLKSDYQYSAGLVYNNFPWPEKPTDEQKKRVEECAQAVLDARAAHPGATLADLYDPLTMPADLLKAHHALDRAVDACYGTRTFKDEPERLEFLFDRYKALSA